ncbi:odorant receptor 67d isoform X2 [Culex quinquefasciatus]|uniref:odorant receptor 67d isoform X2 n=1 Tax=Culex quinquefasciatus TaxID=7176 RepID=UPI0018E2FFEE|nr:odorant receptor 67d isoform X2 [Culex quinquefasciatus]
MMVYFHSALGIFFFFIVKFVFWKLNLCCENFDYSNAGKVYLEAVDWIDRLNAFMGICYFDPKVSRLQPRFIWGITTLFIYIYLAFESTYWYRNDVEKLLLCITTHGFSVQMASKVYTFIINRSQVVEVNTMNRDYFEMETTKSVTVQNSHKSSATIAYILLKMTAACYIILVGLIVLGPAIGGAIVSEKILPFGFELSHSNAWPAYIMNLAFHVNCGFYVAFLTTSSDSTFILYLLTAVGQIDAISGLLNELNEMLEKNASEEVISLQLRRIFQLHQHHFAYMRMFKNMFQYYFMMAITMLYFCMSICLAAFVLINWYMGVLVFCFCSAQIFYMCFLGTALQSKTEFLMKEIDSFSWYRLSVPNQKFAILFLASAQNPILLSAAMVKLNVATYLQVHKSVYSFLMLLLRIKQ